MSATFIRGRLNRRGSSARGPHRGADRDNLAEEMKIYLGREQFNKLVSALRVAMLHMLKWDHRRRRRSRSWMLSIEQARLEITDVLDDNPGLKPRVAEAIGRAYRGARIDAAKETGLDEADFPDGCPYSFGDITSRDFSRCRGIERRRVAAATANLHAEPRKTGGHGALRLCPPSDVVLSTMRQPSPPPPLIIRGLAAAGLSVLRLRIAA